MEGEFREGFLEGSLEESTKQKGSEAFGQRLGTVSISSLTLALSSSLTQHTQRSRGMLHLDILRPGLHPAVMKF